MDADAPAHAEPVGDRHHRKIEIQSPHDFTFLKSNLIASAREKLDLHFPPSARQTNGRTPAADEPATIIALDGVKPADPDRDRGFINAPGEKQGSEGQVGEEEEDSLRARVRELVDAFMTRTWEGAARNVSVNGMDATSLPILSKEGRKAGATEPREEKEGVDFVYEGYDSRLQAKVASLYGDLETLTAQVSRLRRTAPGQGAERLHHQLGQAISNDDAEYERHLASIRNKYSKPGMGNLELRPQRDGWHGDVSVMYERGAAELAALAGLHSGNVDGSAPPLHRGTTLTETVGKVQRARTVGLEFE